MPNPLSRCINAHCALPFEKPKEHEPYAGFCPKCRAEIKEKAAEDHREGAVFMTIKHEDEMTPGEYRRWQKDRCACFPRVCGHCEGELTGMRSSFCTECGDDFHERCFPEHRCLDAVNES